MVFGVGLIAKQGRNEARCQREGTYLRNGEV
jgi:hypothetical protein